MKKWNEVWRYLCNLPRYDLIRYYVNKPNEVSKAFWKGVLAVLELEGKITQEDSINIWNEMLNEKRFDDEV